MFIFKLDPLRLDHWIYHHKHDFESHPIPTSYTVPAGTRVWPFKWAGPDQNAQWKVWSLNTLHGKTLKYDLNSQKLIGANGRPAGVFWGIKQYQSNVILNIFDPSQTISKWSANGSYRSYDTFIITFSIGLSHRFQDYGGLFIDASVPAPW